MDFLDVNDNKKLQELIKHYENGVNVFVLIFMNGCGPCEATKPKWQELKNKKWENSIVSQIDKDIIESEDGVFNLNSVKGFPTIRHYSKGKKEKDYEGERTPAAFEKWINSKVDSGADRSKPTSVHTGHFSKRKRGGSRSKRSKRSKKRSRKPKYNKN